MTHILAILDRSGSMGPLAEDTIGGVNSFLKEQQGVEGEARLTTILFDHEYQVLDGGVPLDEATMLSRQNYVPRGSTALLDAIGRGIGQLKETDPDKAVIFIYSDGKENASKEWSTEQVKDLISDCEARDWKVVFGAADLGAISEAQVLNIDPNFQTVTGRSSEGIKTFYNSTSELTTEYRTNISNKDQDHGKRTKN